MPGWRFDLRDGSSERPARATVYSVKVEDGRLYLLTLEHISFSSSSRRMLKNSAFTLRQACPEPSRRAQGERVGCWNRWRFSVRPEPVEARKSLVQQPARAHFL